MKEYLKSLIGLMFGAIALTLPAATSAQSGIGGGGTGGNPGITINRVRTGVDTWTYPTQINGVWSQKTLTYDYATGILSVTGEQPIQSIPPLCNVHWDYAPAAVNHGSISLSGTFEYTVQLPAGQNVKSIWVKVTSKSNVGFWAHSSTIGTDNGLGDDEEGNDTWRKMEGAHLRKVSIDDQGTGHFSVSVNAHGTVDGAIHVQMGGSVIGSLEPDPRSISLPIYFDYKQLTTRKPYTVDWVKFSAQSKSSHNQICAQEPFPSIHGSTTLNYLEAERIVKYPVSTDTLSLYLSAKIGPKGSMIRRYGTIDPLGDLIYHEEGSDHRDLDYGSGYSGAIESSMRPVNSSAKFHAGPGQSQLFDADFGNLSDISPVKVDYLLRVEKELTGDNKTLIIKYPGERSGQFTGKFDFADGVKAKTKVDFQFASVAEIAEESPATTYVKKPNGSTPEGYFSPITAWSDKTTGSAIANAGSPGYQNDIMLLNASVGTLGAAIAFLSAEAAPAVVLILSLCEVGLGSYLDSSSDFGQLTWYEPRDLNSYYWTIDNASDFDPKELPEGFQTYSAARAICSWRAWATPYEKLYVQARNLYDESGFVRRAGTANWVSQRASVETAKWFRFKLETLPGGGTTS